MINLGWFLLHSCPKARLVCLLLYMLLIVSLARFCMTLAIILNGGKIHRASSMIPCNKVCERERIRLAFMIRVRLWLFLYCTTALLGEC